MRLRTQFASLFAGAAVFAVVAVSLVGVATLSLRDSAQAQDSAQTSLREARGLLALSYEYALYGHERSATQWRIRYTALQRSLSGDALGELELQGELEALPELFSRLTIARQAPAQQAALRRAELLTDNLINDTQNILEAVNNWTRKVELRRADRERQLAWIAIAGPLLALATMAVLGTVLSTRVVRPLAHLQLAMSRLQAGDLSVRHANTASDEIGDLARAFDAMAVALQHSVRALGANEQRLRMITNNLPARIAYFDQAQRYGFANQACCDAHSAATPPAMTGRTLLEVYGTERYAAIAGHVKAALGGERRMAVIREHSAAGLRDNEYVLIPDRDAAGSVQGCYLMVLDLTDRIESQRRVEAALSEKEVLLREIHHRVKNNLQVVSSLLMLQSGQIEVGQSAHNALLQSQERIRSMALIHERLYQTRDFAAVEFAEYVQDLTTMLAAANDDGTQRIRIELQTEPIRLELDRAVPAGLLLNELVSNAFKHAFPGGRAGCITVRLSSDEPGGVLLGVADDGVGPPAGMVPNASSTLGLRLVHLLAGQLDGRLDIETRDGFVCTLRFADSARCDPKA